MKPYGDRRAGRWWFAWDLAQVPVPYLRWYWRGADGDDRVGTLAVGLGQAASAEVELRAPRWARGILGALAR